MSTLTEPLPPTARELGRWSLSALLADTEAATVERALDDLEAATTTFEAWRERLGPDLGGADLERALDDYEVLRERADVLGALAGLRFAEDTASSAALAFRSRMQQVLTGIANRTLFFDLWWKSLEEEDAARFLPDDPDRRRWLEQQRLFRPYTLDERSEQLINTKDANGISAVLTLYSMLTNRLEFRLEEDGETKVMTQGELRSRFYSPRPETRAAAYGELNRVFGEEAKILAQIYSHRVRDWHAENVEIRGIGSPIGVRNLANEIPDAAVDTLLEVSARNAPLFQEYFRLKAGWLGMERLRRVDVYAPLRQSEREVPWPDAIDEVLATFAEFDPGLGEMAARVFRDDHVDSEIRKGKKSGAFCATVLPRLTPWVLVNYTGRVRDVATLAHELGHAVHSLMAAQHSHLVQHPCLPLAETASVFSEMLMTDRLLARESDPAVRRDLLATALDDIYATVLRQAFFVRFEVDAHRAILEGADDEALHEHYLANLREQFGDSIDLSEDFRTEWVAIPHLFQTPFYCYAYSFGQLLVLALYQRYLEEGDAFKPGYLRLLAHGGAVPPVEALDEIGVDIASDAFWQGGFDVVRGMLDELRQL